MRGAFQHLYCIIVPLIVCVDEACLAIYTCESFHWAGFMRKIYSTFTFAALSACSVPAGGAGVMANVYPEFVRQMATKHLSYKESICG